MQIRFILTNAFHLLQDNQELVGHRHPTMTFWRCLSAHQWEASTRNVGRAGRLQLHGCSRLDRCTEWDHCNRSAPRIEPGWNKRWKAFVILFNASYSNDISFVSFLSLYLRGISSHSARCRSSPPNPFLSSDEASWSLQFVRSSHKPDRPFKYR